MHTNIYGKYLDCDFERFRRHSVAYYRAVRHPPPIIYSCNDVLLYFFRAEIWSVCWSPSNSRIATCLEDQTVCVWDTSSWVGVAKLTGHTLAVTSVDWTVAKGRSLLALCSDDRVSDIITCNIVHHSLPTNP